MTNARCKERDKRSIHLERGGERRLPVNKMCATLSYATLCDDSCGGGNRGGRLDSDSPLPMCA